MSLVNTSIVDLGAGTVTFSSISSPTTVENIVFTASSNQITFGIIPGITLDPDDFYTLLNQLTIFQTAIIYNFTLGTVFNNPFNSFVSNEHYISFTNSWSLTCNEVSGPAIVEYYASQSSNNIAISARSGAITIPFSEWVDLLASLKHYQTSLSTFLP
jgi:hypothetical protein